VHFTIIFNEYDFLISHRKIKFASNLDKLNRFNCANYDESGFKIFKPSLPVDMGISMPFKEFEIFQAFMGNNQVINLRCPIIKSNKTYFEESIDGIL